MGADGKAPPLIVEDFPPELKRRLRVLAAQEDTTMRALVIDGVEAWVAAREAALPGAEPAGARRGP
jgi:Antitoxin-like ribbon-helix-helix